MYRRSGSGELVCVKVRICNESSLTGGYLFEKDEQIHNRVVMIVYKSDDFLSRPKKSVDICILCSSFNPPTNAHLRLIQQSLAMRPFDAVVLVLSSNNPDKSMSSDKDHEHRINMMRLLTSCIEIPMAVLVTDRGTFFDIHQSLGLEVFPNISFNAYFIVGYDTFVRIYAPKYYHADLQSLLTDFFATAHLICADRFRNDTEISLTELIESVTKQYGHGDHIHQLTDWTSGKDTSFHISSSLVRQSVHDRNDARSSLVPTCILKYIESNGLYRQ